MSKLKLGAILDDRTVKLTIELPAQVNQDLTAFAEVLGRETGQTIEPAKLTAPVLARFMSRDRPFARSQRGRRGIGPVKARVVTPLGGHFAASIRARLMSLRRAGLLLFGDHTALNGSIACNRPGNHFRKRGGRRGFACKAHSKTQRDKVHERVPPNIETLDARVITKIGEPRDEVVMNLRPQLRLTEDELLVA